MRVGLRVGIRLEDGAGDVLGFLCLPRDGQVGHSPVGAFLIRRGQHILNMVDFEDSGAPGGVVRFRDLGPWLRVGVLRFGLGFGSGSGARDQAHRKNRHTARISTASLSKKMLMAGRHDMKSAMVVGLVAYSQR